jgi:hypothetical protein
MTKNYEDHYKYFVQIFPPKPSIYVYPLQGEINFLTHIKIRQIIVLFNI